MIEQLIPRRKFRIRSKEFGNKWQTISYQKKASDVELEGGETVQHRIDNLVAKITELSNVIRNFKTQEGTDHDAFKRRIGLLYEQIRSGIGGVYNTFLTIEAEGEGAEDYNRLSGEFNTFQNQTRTKLTQLEADVEELLSYEPDAEGGVEKVDAYDYLDKLIDELEEYMSLVLTQLAQVIGDGDITDVLLNANVDITDQTDTSLAAALKIQHGKISGLETIMNQMGVGNPPYIWERYEYSSLDDPATCPVKVTAMTNTGDTTTYVPVWRVVFFYQPVFKLLKMTGYMGVSGTGTLDRSVYLSMDVETNKLRFFYTLLDNYERYQWINQDENGVISTVLDQYIDPRQGLLRNGYDSTTVLRVEQWSGLTLPSYYNFNYLGISMGDTGDTAYNPSGFSVWDSGLPEKPQSDLYSNIEKHLKNIKVQRSFSGAANENTEEQWELFLNYTEFNNEADFWIEEGYRYGDSSRGLTKIGITTWFRITDDNHDYYEYINFRRQASSTQFDDEIILNMGDDYFPKNSGEYCGLFDTGGGGLTSEEKIVDGVLYVKWAINFNIENSVDSERIENVLSYLKNKQLNTYPYDPSKDYKLYFTLRYSLAAPLDYTKIGTLKIITHYREEDYGENTALLFVPKSWYLYGGGIYITNRKGQYLSALEHVDALYDEDRQSQRFQSSYYGEIEETYPCPTNEYPFCIFSNFENVDKYNDGEVVIAYTRS